MSERRGLSLSTYLALGLRNLTRHGWRTGLTLASLVIAIGALTFLIAMQDGWLGSMRENFVLTLTGHLQVHGAGFEHTRDRRPDSDHSSTPGAGSDDRLSGGFGQFEALRVQPVVGEIFSAKRAKGAESDVEDDLGALDSALLQLRDKRVCHSRGGWRRSPAIRPG